MDDVEGRFGQRIDADVVATQLDVRRQPSGHPVDVDVGRHYPAGWSDPFAHVACDRSAPGTHFETVPAGPDPEPIEVSAGDLVIERRRGSRNGRRPAGRRYRMDSAIGTLRN